MADRTAGPFLDFELAESRIVWSGDYLGDRCRCRSVVPDWLSARRAELAADRILDAAERLFTQRDPASIGMNEIAKAKADRYNTVSVLRQPRGATKATYVHRRLGREIMVKIMMSSNLPNGCW